MIVVHSAYTSSDVPNGCAGVDDDAACGGCFGLTGQTDKQTPAVRVNKRFTADEIAFVHIDERCKTRLERGNSGVNICQVARNTRLDSAYCERTR